jgi:hypothetical protein
MLDASTIVAAWVSLLGSAFTIWFTMFRRGTVRMTQPAFILFGPENGGEGRPKLAVGAHLYTTAQRGAIVEAMFARVTRGGTTQDFDVWVYGKGTLSRGSAVHVGQEGVTGDHHFLLPQGAAGFEWLPGQYTVEIFGTIVGRRGPHRFWQLEVTLADSIHETEGSVFFDWRPALGKYEGHVFARRERVRAEFDTLRELLFNGVGIGDGPGAKQASDKYV